MYTQITKVSPKAAKAVLNKRNKAGGIIRLKFKKYYEVVTETARF